MFSFFNGPVFLSLSGGSRPEIPQRVHGVRAMTFDVFGTVVDWRTSIAKEAEVVGRAP